MRTTSYKVRRVLRASTIPRYDEPMSGPNGARPGASASTFAGRFAIVVGGSGGIGRAVSAELAERGAKLLVHGLRASTKAIDIPGGPHFAFDHKFENAHGFLSALDARLREINLEPDIVVCAFGPFLERALGETTTEEWERLALSNLALPGALSSHFLPGMMRRNYGRFLFFGGTRTDTIRGFRQTAAYAAAKTGLGVLVKSIAMEGATHNVAAALVCPGPTETEYQAAATKARHASLTENGTLARAEMVARASIDLIDADPCIASGAIVALDSGFAP